MFRSMGLHASVGFAVAVTIVMGSAPPARAQAYLPAQDEGTVSVVFQDLSMKYHFLPTAQYDRGQIRGETLLVDVTYGLTDKVAVTIGIPWVASKYTGAFPHPLPDFSGPNPIDDGTYHSTFQDLRFDLRYSMTKKGMALTPFIGSIVPSNDYTYFAHSAPGRHLKELQVGVMAAKLLDSFVPGLFVQSRYSYGFAEQVLDISHNRSNLDLELGYFVTPRLRVLALGAGQLTHGGVDLTTQSRIDLGDFLWVRHDQIDRLNFLNVGGGASYALTEKVDIFGSMIHTIAQRNGHAIDRGLSVGLGYSFSTSRAKAQAIASAEHSLAKCLCEKSAN